MTSEPKEQRSGTDKRLGYGKRKGNGIALVIIAIWAVVVAGVAIIRTFVVSGGAPPQ